MNVLTFPKPDAVIHRPRLPRARAAKPKPQARHRHPFRVLARLRMENPDGFEYLIQIAAGMVALLDETDTGDPERGA